MTPEMFGPYEKHTMPSGDSIYYRDKDHTYHSFIMEKGGKWVGAGRWGDLPSPSQIAKFADPNPDALMDWAARKQIDGVYKLGDLNAFDGADAIRDALKKHKLTWRDLRDSAGDTGTIVHHAFEEALHGHAIAFEDAPEECEGHLRALDKFFAEHTIEPLQTECVVYSKSHKFAGRFDARVEMDIEVEGRATPISATALLDLKTSKYIGRAYHAQLHGYDIAAEECGYGRTDRLLILQTRADGTYALWPCRSSRQTFLHALALYRAGKECDKATRADYKALAA